MKKILTRAALITVGCIPMIYVYCILTVMAAVSLVMVFYLPFWMVAGSFLWWLIGSVGFVALVYSSATFDSSVPYLPRWRRIALISGIAAAAPVILWFLSNQRWLNASFTVLGCLVAIFLIFNHYRDIRKKPNKTLHPTAGNAPV